jgi:hypothetical protein
LETIYETTRPYVLGDIMLHNHLGGTKDMPGHKLDKGIFFLQLFLGDSRVRASVESHSPDAYSYIGHAHSTNRVRHSGESNSRTHSDF